MTRAPPPSRAVGKLRRRRLCPARGIIYLLCRRSFVCTRFTFAADAHADKPSAGRRTHTRCPRPPYRNTFPARKARRRGERDCCREITAAAAHKWWVGRSRAYHYASPRLVLFPKPNHNNKIRARVLRFFSVFE